MKKSPSKASTIRTRWLDMPTGLAISWENSLDHKLFFGLMDITNDYEEAKDDPKFLAIQLTSLLHGKDYTGKHTF